MPNSQRKKLLIISLEIPFPLTHGGAIAQFFFLEKLSKFHDITFCSFANDQKDKDLLNGLAVELPGIKIIYGAKKHSPKQEFFLFNLLRKFYRFLNSKTTVTSQDDTLQNSIYITNSSLFAEPELAIFIAEHLKRHNYDIIQLEFFETLSLLGILPASVTKVFIHHEIRSKRYELANIDPSNAGYKEYVVKSIKLIEKCFLKLADRLVVFSRQDRDYLTEINKKILVSPFGIPEKLISKKKTSAYFNKFLVLGNESHWPNKEGLKWFFDNIYIPNQQVIDWPVYITGNWSKDFILTYMQYQNIKFVGFIENVDTFYENSVLLTPILSGSGIRTKILQAFANKVPVLSTTFASEGLDDSFSKGPHILHFQDENDFVATFHKIKTDIEYLGMIANNAHAFFIENFNPLELIKKRNEAYL